MHVFQGGCEGEGDYVADTPPEAEPSDGGCTTARDTCKGDKRNDPLTNYMVRRLCHRHMRPLTLFLKPQDYSIDKCLSDFTPGQAARVKAMVGTYRGVAI